MIERRLRGIFLKIKQRRFRSSRDYWEKRYTKGGTSGSGSYGRLATFKAEIINDFVAENNVRDVIEFGCGDGNQLALAEYESYTGIDVSPTAINVCREKFSNDLKKTFLTNNEYDGRTADMSMSLDVIYHLVEDNVFDRYMGRLFDAARRYVVIYSSNRNGDIEEAHVRHRKFSDWVDVSRPDFRCIRRIPNRFPFDPADKENTSFADFFFYEKADG